MEDDDYFDLDDEDNIEGVYSEEELETLTEDDAITPEESFFMLGYNEL